MAEKRKEMINLNDWFLDDRNDEAKRDLFVGLSDAQKNLNNLGYAINSFNFNDIYLDEGDSKKIQYSVIRPLPDDIDEKRREVSNEIFVLVLMQIGIYSDCLNNISSNSIKENFDLFLPFLPAEDVPYYKSVVSDHFEDKTRCVYFCDYARELYRRKPSEEKKEEGQSASEGKTLSKRNGNKLIDIAGEFKPVNNYGIKNAAFVNFVVIPIGVIIAGLLLTVISWFMK